MLSFAFLAGKRTYILGGVMALQAVASLLTGVIDFEEFMKQLPEILTGLGLMSLRAGIK